MKLNSENLENMAIITLDPETVNTEKFKASLMPIVIKHKNLIFDMSQIKWIDSKGCGVLLTCLRKLNVSGGDLKLCSVRKSVLTLFELIRIHRIIEIFATQEEAAASF